MDAEPGDDLKKLLKPCPFCDETLLINNANLAVHSRESDCLLRQHVVVLDDPKQVERWNRRAGQTTAADFIMQKVGSYQARTAQAAPNGESGCPFGCETFEGAERRHYRQLTALADELRELGACSAPPESVI